MTNFQTPNSYFLQPLHGGWHITTVNKAATHKIQPQNCQHWLANDPNKYQQLCQQLVSE
jgi:hypothetical protein